MPEQLRVVVLTSCTNEKRYSPENRLTQLELESVSNNVQLTEIETRFAQYRLPAEEMYTGQQHVRLMEGVKTFRETFGPDSLDLKIVSAGYGLIAGDRQVVPYEATFQGMNKDQRHRWTQHLHIPEMVRGLLSEKADFVFVSLGDAYLRALELDESTMFASPTV